MELGGKALTEIHDVVSAYSTVVHHNIYNHQIKNNKTLIKIT